MLVTAPIVIDKRAVDVSSSQVVAVAVDAPRASMGKGSRGGESPLNSIAGYPPVEGAGYGGTVADAVVQPAIVTWSIGASSVIVEGYRLFVPFSVVLQVCGVCVCVVCVCGLCVCVCVVLGITDPTSRVYG